MIGYSRSPGQQPYARKEQVSAGAVPDGGRRRAGAGESPLRKINAVLDLSFLREAVAECYSTSRGRPSVDPELALRMMLLGRLYDLGDRELCDEIGIAVVLRAERG